MQLLTRLVTVAAAAALGALALVPAAQAAKPPPPPPPSPPVFTMADPSVYEYTKSCSTQGPPYDCPTTAQAMHVQIWTPSPVSEEATFGYVIEPITATEGADYTGTTGTAVMAANRNWTYIVIPVSMDGVAEPSETLRVRLTSSSVGGDISDTAIGTIHNDGEIPADCTLTRPSLKVTSLECTNRPPTQSWRIEVVCLNSGWGALWFYGQTITGNGTSVVTCDIIDEMYGPLRFSVLS